MSSGLERAGIAVDTAMRVCEALCPCIYEDEKLTLSNRTRSDWSESRPDEDLARSSSDALAQDARPSQKPLVRRHFLSDDPSESESDVRLESQDNYNVSVLGVNDVMSRARGVANDLVADVARSEKSGGYVVKEMKDRLQISGSWVDQWKVFLADQPLCPATSAPRAKKRLWQKDNSTHVVKITTTPAFEKQQRNELSYNVLSFETTTRSQAEVANEFVQQEFSADSTVVPHLEGPRGIRNENSVCFANAVLQCICAIEPFVQKCFECKWRLNALKCGTDQVSSCRG